MNHRGVNRIFIHAQAMNEYIIKLADNKKSLHFYYLTNSED